MNEFNILDEWLSRYSYQSGDADTITSSEHSIRFTVDGDILVGRSLPQDDGSELTLELHYDASNHVLTGTWQEKTAESGAYGGAIFHGTLQLIVNEDITVVEGKWLGFNSAHTTVKVGEWRIEKK